MNAQKEECRHSLRCALDAVRRCIDGMESETYHYAADQAKKAAQYLSDLAFRLDLADLLNTQPSPLPCNALKGGNAS